MTKDSSLAPSGSAVAGSRSKSSHKNPSKGLFKVDKGKHRRTKHTSKHLTGYSKKKDLKSMKKGGGAGSSAPHKKRRHGSVATRDIRKLQQSTKLIMPHLPFARLVRKLTIKEAERLPLRVADNPEDDDNLIPDKRFQKEAIVALQTAVETIMGSRLRQAYRCTVLAGRQTLKPDDFDVANSEDVL